jgi:hypothetical protein
LYSTAKGVSEKLAKATCSTQKRSMPNLASPWLMDRSNQTEPRMTEMMTEERMRAVTKSELRMVIWNWRLSSELKCVMPERG